MNWRAGVFLLAVVAAVSLWIVNCSGPAPAVSDVRLVEPSGEGAPYRVEATVWNRRRGHGQVTVTFRLRDAGAGRTIEQEESVTLGGYETALVVTEVPAPRGHYAVEAAAEYPPR